jgi:hypothetical protein
MALEVTVDRPTSFRPVVRKHIMIGVRGEQNHKPHVQKMKEWKGLGPYNPLSGHALKDLKASH